MKTLIHILAVAAALGLTPVAAAAQDNLAQPAAELTAPAQPAAESAAANPADAEAVAADTIRSAPVASVGQPDGRLNFQDQFTPIGEQGAWFHNAVLLPVITAISVLVLVLMLFAIARFRRAANPVPSRTTHNTVIEVIWTLVPVLILVVVAVPSIKLLAAQYSPPKADLTVKAIGNQWYWTYQYPDNGDFEIVSNMLPDEEAKAKGEPRQLAVDERMVVPVGAVVKVIVTSNDVIHAFGIPGFWVKIDAVPGRLNETWFKVDRPGVYYGQCYELCGARHGYMPIAVDVVSKEQFAAWVAAKGGSMPDAAPAEAAPAAVTTAALTTTAPAAEAATSNPKVAE